MTVAIASFTAAGAALGERLAGLLIANGHIATHTLLRDGGLAEWTAEQFASRDALVFVGATGIAVRAVAPHLRSKTTDPAVLSLDEQGRYVVPLVSGHIGGANALAKAVARYCGGVAVISTATDLNGLFAVDSWAVGQGLWIANPERIKRVSSKLLDGEDIVVHSDWELSGAPPEHVVADPQSPSPDIRITWEHTPVGGALLLVPPALVVGIGCKRDTPESAIEALFQQLVEEHGLLAGAVRRAATIDIKSREPGLLAFCGRRGLSLSTYGAEQLRGVSGAFSGSPFVERVTGVDNVCERAAVLAGGGPLIVEKQSRDGVTMAVAASPVRLRF